MSKSGTSLHSWLNLISSRAHGCVKTNCCFRTSISKRSKVKVAYTSYQLAMLIVIVSRIVP